MTRVEWPVSSMVATLPSSGMNENDENDENDEEVELGLPWVTDWGGKRDMDT
jgi:hypothetical protein